MVKRREGERRERGKGREGGVKEGGREKREGDTRKGGNFIILLVHNVSKTIIIWNKLPTLCYINISLPYMYAHMHA